MLDSFLSWSSSEAHVSGASFFGSLDFGILWHSGMTASLTTEVKLLGYFSTWMGDHLSALLVSIMAL